MKLLLSIIPVCALIYYGCAARIEKDDNNRGPVMISTVEPVYPKEALRKGIEGEVLVKMWVDTLGKVTKVFVEKSPDTSLSNAALDAAIRTKFKPAMLAGRPIGVWYITPFTVKKK